MKNPIISIIMFLVFWGCASSPRSGSTEETSSKLPSWFSNRIVAEDYYYGYGMAKKQNPSLGMKAATARARDDIGAQISIKVENLIKDFLSESGVGENAQSIEFTSTVSKQVISKTLSGCVPDKQETASDGTWYVRVQYSKTEARNAVLEAAKREEALFNELEAEKGFDELAEIINSLE